jgi:xanthine dehydrogenase large subunit
VIGGSKAVGEPPFMLAIGVLGALRDAIRALRPGRSVRLALPATNENVLRAVAG